ncbi:MAG TPA: diacylglycerol kinase family protein [Solirubrobacteraceae bacterium]|nr:diacylglycerol kinase family protein [Solirubrobacteraceae bacterium]
MLWVIVNPSAGDGRTGARLGRISTELTRLGLDHALHPTTNLAHAAELAVAALEAGAMPVAFGGDGLIGTVAGAVAHSGSVMGILPGGRGNDIARTLGIPRDPLAACALLRGGRDRSVDLGRLEDRPFLGIAFCGLDSAANHIANTTRLVRGAPAYSYGGLRALASWRAAAFSVELDGHARTLRGFSVAVANARAYGGGMLLAPGAEIDDGELDVVLIADMPKLRFLVHMPEIFRGRHVRMPEVTVLRGREVTITADRPLRMFADGEEVTSLPARVRVEPAAVRIRVAA